MRIRKLCNPHRDFSSRFLRGTTVSFEVSSKLGQSTKKSTCFTCRLKMIEAVSAFLKRIVFSEVAGSGALIFSASTTEGSEKCEGACAVSAVSGW